MIKKAVNIFMGGRLLEKPDIMGTAKEIIPVMWS